MTRTVESPRGGHASLTITPGDDGVVYLRAANVVSEVTVPLLAADLLAAIADELGVIVVDRADLPAVTEHVGGLLQARPAGMVPVILNPGRKPADLRTRGLAYLALAEHLAQHPPVDEQQVEALAGLLDEDDHTVLGSGEALDTLARRLVARGVRVGGESRG